MKCAGVTTRSFLHSSIFSPGTSHERHGTLRRRRKRQWGGYQPITRETISIYENRFATLLLLLLPRRLAVQSMLSATLSCGRQLSADEAAALAFESLCDLLPDDDHSFLRPVHPELDQRRPLSYGALRRFSETVAADLACAGLAAGARVACALPNGPELATLFLALTSLGLTFAPLNPAPFCWPFVFSFGCRRLCCRRLCCRPVAASESSGMCAWSSLGDTLTHFATLSLSHVLLSRSLTRSFILTPLFHSCRQIAATRRSSARPRSPSRSTTSPPLRSSSPRLSTAPPPRAPPPPRSAPRSSSSRRTEARAGSSGCVRRPAAATAARRPPSRAAPSRGTPSRSRCTRAARRAGARLFGERNGAQWLLRSGYSSAFAFLRLFFSARSAAFHLQQLLFSA